MKNMSIVFLIVLIVITIGCSKNDPVQISPTGINNANLPLFASKVDSDGSPVEGYAPMGVFHGVIDISDLSAELTSLRETALVDALEIVDITNFLTMSPCHDCARIREISLDADGRIVMSVGIKHPFGMADPLKPISGINRADLHVFNVEGIVAIMGDTSTSFPSLSISVSDQYLLNPDGYSAYLDGYFDTIFPTDANTHPYIMHFDDYSAGNFNPSSPTGFESVVDPLPSGNLVMPMGSDYDYQEYIFDIPDGENIEFIYAIGCTYAVSTSVKSDRFTPEYRIPQHNKKAASEVSVAVISNALVAGDPLSTADIAVNILDINHGAPLGTGLDEMEYSSDVSQISVEIPGIIDGLETDFVFDSGDGRDPLNPLKFNMTITNDLGAIGGIYKGLVKVLDSYPTGMNTSPLLNGHDGINRVDPIVNPLTRTFAIDEFATYTTFTIEIGFEPEDPVAVILTNPDPPDVGNSDSRVIFDGSDSYDPDGGPITLFEWDFYWDGDPLTFEADIMGIDPIVEHNYPCVAGSWTAGLRVTDDDTPAGVSTIASVPVTVTDDYSDGTWVGSINLGEERIHGDSVFSTGEMMHLDSTGLIHIISLDSYDIYHRTWDGTTMSPRESVPETATSLRMVSSSIDSNDELHVIWISSHSPGVAVYHMETSGGVFTGVEDMLYDETDADYFNTSMTVATNNQDHTMVAWINYDWDKVDVHYMYALDTGSGFAPAEDMPYEVHIRMTDTPNPSYLTPGMNLVTTPDNKFHYFAMSRPADLSGSGTLYQHVFDGSTWAPKIYIYGTGWGIVHPQVAAENDGDIHLSVRIPPLGTSNMRYKRYDHETDIWGDLLYVAEDARGFQYGDVQVDNNGFIYVAYCSNIDDMLRMKVFCEYAEQADLDAIPTQIIDDTTEPYHNDIDFEFDADGNLLALYQDYSSTNGSHLYFNVYSY